MFSCEVVADSATPWAIAHQASLSFIISWSLLRFMSIKLVMLSNHLNLFHPFLLPSVFPSLRVFSSESALRIRWSKYLSFNISPSNECSGVIFFMIDWFDLLAVQGTLKSLFQLYSLKASVLQWPDGAAQITNPETYPTSRFPEKCIINYLTV